MSDYSRYAVYYLPEPGPLADFGAKWLGWDVQAKTECAAYDLVGWGEITQTPRKYGFHGTLKPPFRLAEGKTVTGLIGAVSNLAAHTAPAQCDGLGLTRLGRFLALTAIGDKSGISRIANACVAGLDEFRAPPMPQDLERRRASGLSPRQDEYLGRWGYPYVFEEFRFHMTLTGKLSKARLPKVEAHLRQAMPELPAPFRIGSICLLGERPDTRFELIHRYALSA